MGAPRVRRKTSRRRPTPQTRPVSNWELGLVEYPESGRVPESGLVDIVNNTISYDGSIVNRPYEQVMDFGGGSRITTSRESDIQEVSFNNHTFLMAIRGEGLYVSDDSAFSVSLRASLSSGWKILKPPPFLEVHPASLVSYDKFRVVGDQIVFYDTSGTHTYAYIELDPDPDNIELITRKSVSGPIDTEVEVPPTLNPVNDDGQWAVYIKVAYRNELGQNSNSWAINPIPVNRPPVLWDSGETIHINIRGADRTSNATHLDVFMGLNAGQELLVKSEEIDYDAPRTSNTWPVVTSIDIDDVKNLDPSTSAPSTDVKENTTYGIRATQVEFINSRLYMVGHRINSPTDISRRDNTISYGGVSSDNRFNFAPTTATGYFTVGLDDESITRITAIDEPGGNDTLAVFTGFVSEDGTGNKRITGGAVYTATATIEQQREYQITRYRIKDIPGQPTTIAPESVVSYNGSIWYLSVDGFRVLGPQPDFQNLIASNLVDQTIRGTVDEFLFRDPDGAYQVRGLYHNRRIYWIVPELSGEFKSPASEGGPPRINSTQILVFDIQRNQGAWSRWAIDADRLLLGHDPVDNALTIITTRGAFSQSEGFIRRLTDKWNVDCYSYGSRWRTGRIRLANDQAFLSFCLAIHVYIYNARGESSIYAYIKHDTEDEPELVRAEVVELEVPTHTSQSPGMNLMDSPVSEIDDYSIEDEDRIVKQKRATIEINEGGEWAEVFFESPHARSGETISYLPGGNKPNEASVGSMEIVSIPIYPDLDTTPPAPGLPAPNN